MKLLFAFEMLKIDDEYVAVPIGDNTEGFHGVMKLNDTGKQIFELLQEGNDIEEIVNDLLNEYTECEKSDIFVAVHDFIQELIKNGIVCDG